MAKKFKLKPIHELKKLSYLQSELCHSLITTNRNQGWKAFPKDIYEKEIIISDDKYVLTSEEYEAFKDLFDEVEEK